MFVRKENCPQYDLLLQTGNIFNEINDDRTYLQHHHTCPTTQLVLDNEQDILSAVVLPSINFIEVIPAPTAGHITSSNKLSLNKKSRLPRKVADQPKT